MNNHMIMGSPNTSVYLELIECSANYSEKECTGIMSEIDSRPFVPSKGAFFFIF